MSRFAALVTSAVLAVGVSVALVPAASGQAATPSDAASTPGGYVPVTTSRLLSAKSVAAHGHATVAVGSAVPSGAAAVVTSISLSAGKASGVLTASAGDVTSTPKVATVSFAPGQGVGDLAVVPLDGGTSVRFWNNSAAPVSLTVDLSGYYAGGSATTGGGYVPETGGAVRVADTRHGTDGNRKGALPAKGVMAAHIAGRAGVGTGAASVAVTVTVIGATASGVVNVRTSGGSTVPSTMQIQAGRQASQLVVVPLSAGGAIAIANGTGKPIQVAVDVSGYYRGGAADSAFTTQTVEASDVASHPVAARSSRRFVVAGEGGVPLTGATAAVVTLRVVKAAAFGTLSAAGGTAPTVVQFSTGSTRSGVVIARVDSSGAITVSNHAGKAVSVQVDVDGYVPGTSVTEPVPSRSHYIRVTSASQVADAGTQDALDGSTFVVLDIGAQSNDRTGVVLSATNTRVTYAKLESLVGDYVDAYTAQSSAAVTVAVATNNSGDFTAFNAAGRGRRWATLLQDLRAQTAGTPQVTVLAADDIESGFAYSSTEAQAQTWENEFLGALPATSSTPTDLYFIGSADGCPTVFGQTGRTCANRWTQAQYVQLAGGSGAYAGRIQALPQIYLRTQAVQWADIAASARGGRTMFDGSLTEHAACPSASSSGCGFASMTAAEGYAALYRSLSSVTTTPGLTYATDLDIVG